MRISIEDLNLKPTPLCSAAFPRGGLKGSLHIGGQMFHVEAYQVEIEENGTVAPVLQEYQEEVEALYSLASSSLATLDIEGIPYVIAVFPHAR